MTWGLASAAAAVLLGGVAAPGSGDWSPRVSHDGTAIVFRSDRDGGTVRVIGSDGSGERTLFALRPDEALALSRDWRWVAYTDHARDEIVVMTPEGAERRVVAHTRDPIDVAFSPDGATVAYAGSDGLHVVGVDATGARRLAARGRMPRWSPDGASLAFVDGFDVYVVSSAGGAQRLLHRAFAENGLVPLDVEWSPDGRFLALAFAGSPVFVPLDGGPAWWMPPDATGAAQLAWEPTGPTIAWGGVDFLVRLDAGTGRWARFETEAHDPTWSPSGDAIVFAARGECKLEYGIYRIGADGSGLARLTNGCRISGSGRRDVLRGTRRVDVLLGNGGDDRLQAVEQPFAGDDLVGGAGRDVLVGGAWDNGLDGGPGGDRIRGGARGDVLIGGPGRDVLDGGSGADAVLAADGSRDRVTCGGGDRDVVSADVVDAVGRDCEITFRMRPVAPERVVALRIVYWVRGRLGPAHRYTVTCEPPRGRHPSPAAACSDLLARPDPFRAMSEGPIRCEPRDARHEPQIAEVDGVFLGRPLHTTLDQADTCELQRWHRVGRLVSALPSGP